jgi:cobalt-zinc-cadmium efflux system membrane fusion protein
MDRTKNGRPVMSHRQMRTIVLRALIIGFGLLMLEGLFAHGGEDHGEAATAAQPAVSAGAGITVAKEQQFALGVLTELAADRDLHQSVEVTGRVVPRTDAVADVIAPLGGRVVGGSVPRLGERVSRGQVLFRVAQVLSPSERTSLRTEQARTRAEMTAAEREVARLEKLEGVVAGKQITEARIRRDAAREVYNAVTAQLSGEGSTVPVTAPISGEIISAEIAPGEVLDGSRVVYRIADLGKVWIEADLFERDIPLVQGATKAEVRTPAVPGGTFNGTLYKVGDEVDPETRTIQALFVVDNPKSELKLNMSASVGVVTSARPDVLSIPRAAVIESGARRVVFVHTASERFEARDVTLGSSASGDYVEVRAGVRKGDRVVITGTHQLRAVAGL